jgi:hypothetical protein
MKTYDDFAFPGPDRGRGMKLRDYFAAAAMQTLCTGGPEYMMDPDRRKAIAAASYAMATEMLSARGEEQSRS